jgi:hypothetical protein
LKLDSLQRPQSVMQVQKLLSDEIPKKELTFVEKVQRYWKKKTKSR